MKKQIEKIVKQKLKRQMEGVVVSNKMTNTVVVQIERQIQHPVYKKYIKRTSKFMADTEGVLYTIGDVVVIEETRPISRNKTFRVVKKVEDKV